MMDLISAFLIGASLLVIVFVLLLRGQETSVGATQHAAAKKGTLSLAQMLDQDFTNIGAGTADPDTAIVAWDTTGANRRFVFWGRADTALQTAQRICYAWSSPGTSWVREGDNYVQKTTYQVDRRVGTAADCSGGTLRGLSMSTVTGFHLRLVDANGDTLAAGPFDDVRQVVVDVEAVSPLGPGQVLDKTTWSKTFHPVNLSKRARD